MKLPTIWPVTCHSNHVGEGSAFVAIKGQNLNGIDFIPEALSRGAKTIIIESGVNLASDIERLILDAGARSVRVDNPRLALAQWSARSHDWPARKLKIIGITGTKGKTTTACVLHHILRTDGYAAALISTVYNKINDQRFDASLTTPQPDYLHMFFNECVKQGIEYVVMEVAAQALSLHRVHDLWFDAVAFTNFGHEHSEFYGTFDAYFNAKVELLCQAKPGAPILINADDQRVSTLSKRFKKAQTFSLKNKQADFYVHLDRADENLSGAIFHAYESMSFICSALLGDFNGANILVAASIAINIGISMTSIAKACATMPALPGRLERYVLRDNIQYVIDYAHTPESYEHVLSLLRTKTHYLVVVFGAGGARDTLKRPIMGAIAARYADCVLLTTDNPRMEDPVGIIADIMSGIEGAQKNKVIVELDREKAIKKSYQLAKKGGIIALLGKGPDEYQLINNIKIPFSEKAIIQQLEK